MNSQLLYGGAIVASVPSTFLDASQFRQVPDNQEVFVDMQTQQSLVFELLEQTEFNNEEIPKEHFRQLAADNDATNFVILSVQKLDTEKTSPLLPQNSAEVYILEGTQSIAKFNESGADNIVNIVLSVVRLPTVTTDFVITINAPIQLSEESSEQKSVQETDRISMDTVKQEILTILGNLKVEDWNLFG